jgi:hypothetical protein
VFTRRFVMAGALVAPFFPANAASAQRAWDERLACHTNLVRLFPTSFAAARSLGEACRSCDTATPSPAALLDSLCPDAATRALVAHGPDEAIRGWADAKIRADFAAGRIARVDGWMLAETEIRLFSLAAAV